MNISDNLKLQGLGLQAKGLLRQLSTFTKGLTSLSDAAFIGAVGGVSELKQAKEFLEVRDSMRGLLEKRGELALQFAEEVTGLPLGEALELGEGEKPKKKKGLDPIEAVVEGVEMILRDMLNLFKHVNRMTADERSRLIPMIMVTPDRMEKVVEEMRVELERFAKHLPPEFKEVALSQLEFLDSPSLKKKITLKMQ